MGTASKQLQILLTLKDQASKELDKFQGKVKSMKPAFQKMALIGGAAFTGLSVGVFKATQKASDAQETFNKFDVVYQDVSDGAEKMAKNLRDNYGLAESTAKDLLSSTGDMLTGFGMTGEMALDLADKTNKLAVDLASFTNIEGGSERASKALTKALLGERESVKELGIAILEEDVKAKIEAMEVSGKFTNETYRQKKAYATLEIAMEQSKNAIGDYARTQGSLANQQRLLKERTKELTEKIGIAFVPILEKVVEKIIPVVNKVADWIAENPKLVTTIVIVAGVLAGLLTVVGLLGIALPILATGFGLLFSPITLIIALIGIIIATGYYLIKHWEDVKELGALMWQTLKDLWKGGVDFVVELVGRFADYVVGRYEKIFNTISGIITKIKEVFVGGWNLMWESIKETMSDVTEWIGEKIGKIIGFFSDLINKVGEAIQKLKDFAREQGSKVLTAWKNLPQNLGFQSGGMVNAPLGSPVPAIVHGGERIIPAGRMAGAGAGGGITVNINGGTYLSEDVALEMGNMIIDRLKLQIRV